MNKLRSVLFAAFLALPFATSFAQVFTVGWAPPPLPVYEQPPCPVAGYIWTPGYWAWDDYYYDYYWVPGVWVPPPRVGLLWTPGWWGWRNNVYVFNQGYWGPTVGFYGGVNYGYGYTGNGYWGGRWVGDNFSYNTAVTRVNKTVINNTYVNNSFAKNVNASRTSFNGGNGGIKAEPNAEQRAAMMNARKEGPTSQQLERQKLASKDQNFRASVNKGKPNQEAIKTFNRGEGAGQAGKQLEGADRLGNMEIQGAGAGGENKPGKLGGEHKRQGAGMNAEQGQGAELAGEQHGANTHGQNVHGNNQNLGNQARMRNKGVEHGDGAHGQNAMNQQMRRQQQMGMGGQHHQQMGPQRQKSMGAEPMGGQHQQRKMGGQNQMGGGQRGPQMQGGGNRPQPQGQQQKGKKKQEQGQPY